MTKIIRIGVAGLGTVGSAVIQLLEQYSQKLKEKKSDILIKILAVSAKDKTKVRDYLDPNMRWYSNPVELAKCDDIDIFVELIGGTEGPAKDAIEAALCSGHHVVSANKAVLSRYGDIFFQLAREKNIKLAFEGAIGGGIPIVKIMQESLIANTVYAIYGILNGTANYILTNMAEKKLSFEACLKEAQKLGYAESDPTFDIEGQDTAHKLGLLSSIAFRHFIAQETIHCEGIKDITLNDIKAAEILGYKIKLLAIGIENEKGQELSVYPALIKQDAQLARIQGVTNAILVQSDLLGDLFLSGPGAGGLATASSVVSDIISIAEQRGRAYPPSTLVKKRIEKETIEPYIQASGYFIRLMVQDQAGVFAQIAQRMANHHISLETILQRAPFEETLQNSKMVILVTHEVEEEAILKAFEDMKLDGYLQEPPKMLRMKHF